MDEDIKRIHLTLYGQIQGVGLRWLIRQKAEELGLGGWVSNLADGSVEVIAEGQRPSLEELVNWCYNKPEGIEISRIKEIVEGATGEFGGFEIQ